MILYLSGHNTSPAVQLRGCGECHHPLFDRGVQGVVSLTLGQAGHSMFQLCSLASWAVTLLSCYSPNPPQQWLYHNALTVTVVEQLL